MADGFDSYERRAIADAVASAMRLEIRNKLSTARNAAHFLQRCAGRSESWRSNPRIEEFLHLIAEELSTADSHLLPSIFPPEGGDAGGARVMACVDQAVVRANVPTNITVKRAIPDLVLAGITEQELVLAIRSLVDNSVEAMDGSGIIEVRAFEQGLVAVIAVSDTGPGSRESSCNSTPVVPTRPSRAESA